LPLKSIYYGIRTILGWGRYGYFIPYRYAGSVPQISHHYQWILDAFSHRAIERFEQILRDISNYRGELESIGGEPPAPRWNQNWFPGLDAAATYALIRETRPRRILEIGSGHSTRFMMRAVRDGGLTTEITCVDPAPRANLEGLDLDLRLSAVQNIDPVSLPRLESGDILFVDSSHIAMPGSDVDWILNRLITGLPKGVLVHFHDIFLPDPYPESWEWRGYNEQIVVAALMAGGRAIPVFSSQFVRHHRSDLIDSLDLNWIRRVGGAIESSLWLEIQ
jgi:hypothetical protein